MVVGASSGGVAALSVLLERLPRDFGAPLVVVLHRGAGSRPYVEEHLAARIGLVVEEAVDKRRLECGHVYVAPGGYHVLIERPGQIALSLEDPENYSRPSIDVLFESAADAFGERLTAVLLTGYGNDGALGLRRVAERGGRTAVQDPATSEVPEMALSAMRQLVPDAVLDLVALADWLVRSRRGAE